MFIPLKALKGGDKQVSVKRNGIIEEQPALFRYLEYASCKPDQA